MTGVWKLQHHVYIINKRLVVGLVIYIPMKENDFADVILVVL